jgi:hypothetical protein
MTHEIDVNELDAVSGGLRDIHQQDLICQRQADANKGTGFGGSLTDTIPGLVVAGSGPNTAGHPFDPFP